MTDAVGSAVFMEAKAIIPDDLQAHLVQVFKDLGLNLVILPFGASLVNGTQFRTKRLDVEIDNFSLVWGEKAEPAIWVSKIDGQQLPLHRRVQIDVEAGGCPPAIKVEFVPIRRDK